VRGVAAVSSEPVSRRLRGLPGLDVVARNSGEIDAAGVGGRVGELGPCVERGRGDGDRAAAVQPDVQMARAGSGDQSPLADSPVGGAVEDL